MESLRRPTQQPWKLIRDHEREPASKRSRPKLQFIQLWIWAFAAVNAKANQSSFCSGCKLSVVILIRSHFIQIIVWFSPKNDDSVENRINAVGVARADENDSSLFGPYSLRRRRGLLASAGGFAEQEVREFSPVDDDDFEEQSFNEEEDEEEENFINFEEEEEEEEEEY